MTQPHRRHRYVHIVDFAAVHHIKSIDQANPEYDMHGHNYTAEIHYASESLYGQSGWGPGELDAAARIDPWILQHMDRANLTETMSFPTTPSQLAAYLYDVAVQFAEPEHVIERVVLIVDNRNRYEFAPDPADQVRP